MINKILSINPGASSTKIAVFHNLRPIFIKDILHDKSKLKSFNGIINQSEYRENVILKELKAANIDLSQIQVVMGRGGLLRPIVSGVYKINDLMKSELTSCIFGEHASNLGAIIADNIASGIDDCKAFIADPVVVDELDDEARISGHPLFQRKSIFHALNHKATGRMYARLINKKYEQINLIIAHMGSGISVAAHRRGKVVDVNQALDGEGPFSPERSGTLPSGDFARYCIEKNLSVDDISAILSSEGGLMAYLNTNSAYEIEIRAIEGDEYAHFIQDAMSYQISKEIGAMASVLKGVVDAIILTGGVSNNTMVVEYIKEMVSFIAPVVIYPGEDEMHALAMNGLMILKGEVIPKEYNEENFVETDMFKDW